MCATGYPSVSAFGTISSNVPPPPKETKKLVVNRTSNRTAPVIVVNLANTGITPKKTGRSSKSESKDYETAFGILSNQFGLGGAAPQPVSSLTASSSSTKSAKKSWLKRLF